MESYENELHPLLHPKEWEMAELAQGQGIAPLVFFNKLREFEATYPDTWPPLLKEWIETSGDERDRAASIAAAKDRIRLKKVRLMELEHKDELESLSAEELTLDARLGSAPAANPALPDPPMGVQKPRQGRKPKQPQKAKE
jgi:hypothetical protein